MKVWEARQTATLFAICGILVTATNVQAQQPREDADFFNGKDLSGWTGTDGYWSVADGVIVGQSAKNVPRNEFLWSTTEVKNFYLSVEVKLEPNNRNAGIQFRSRKVNASGQALGYQADVGAGVWGKLYHEHGRGKLDWNERAAKIIKPGQWNKYEILAVDHRIWTAINGTLCVAIEDPKGELSGHIALQIHGGPPQTVRYRIGKLIHDPKVALAGLDEKQLKAEIKQSVKQPSGQPSDKQPSKSSPRIKPRGSQPASTASPNANWPPLIAAVDPGSKKLIWSKPNFDDSAWKEMKLPIHFEKAGLPDYDGVVWFRKTIELPQKMAGKKATLSLGPIDDMDVTWINGKRVGGMEKPGAHFTARKYSVARGVLQAGRNVIAVRVFDHGWPGGIAGKPQQMSLRIGKYSLPLAGAWRYRAGATLAAIKNAKISAEPKTGQKATGRFSAGFEFVENDVVAFTGAADIYRQQHFGYLETLLTKSAADKHIYFRGMGWQADTVYQRQRPRNFGSQLQELDRVNATIILAAFGQLEALQGSAKLTQFITAYERLLDEYEKRTKKIVLITPMPFERIKDQPSLPDLTRHNDVVIAYAGAIRDLAKRRGYPLIDLSAFNPQGMTNDGIHLTPVGQWRVQLEKATQLLGTSPAAIDAVNDAGAFTDSKLEQLRQAILKKNVLWHQHRRPTNWAFAFGNRQHVPSSHDHRPGKPRWFPAEVQAIVNLIEQAEDQIHTLAQQTSDRPK